MTVVYSNNFNIQTEKLDDLLESINWKKRGNDKWKHILSKTSYLVIAYENHNIIGFGRIVDDGIMCMLYDIVVHPSYQRNGIGTKIMSDLINYTEGKSFASIGLFAWDKNPVLIPFYESMEFEAVTSGMKLKKL